MATIKWPATLPKAPTVKRLSIELAELVQRSQMDVGPAKVRRRVTTNVQPLDVELKLTGWQCGQLRTFFVTTTLGGAEAFEWRDPLTGEPADFRFTSRPVLRPSSSRFYGTEQWTATFTLEQLPVAEDIVEPVTGDNPPGGPGGGGIIDHTPIDAIDLVDVAAIAATMGQGDEQTAQPLIFEADTPPAPDYLGVIENVVPDASGDEGFANASALVTVGSAALDGNLGSGGGPDSALIGGFGES